MLILLLSRLSSWIWKVCIKSFRCDSTQSDPKQLRQRLSEFGNRALEDLWLSDGCPDNIKIVEQPFRCDGELRNLRFGYSGSNSFDGIHPTGRLGAQHYTGSLINALFDAFNFSEQYSKRVNFSPPSDPHRSERVWFGQGCTQDFLVGGEV